MDNQVLLRALWFLKDYQPGPRDPEILASSAGLPGGLGPAIGALQKRVSFYGDIYKGSENHCRSNWEETGRSSRGILVLSTRRDLK